MEFYLKVHKKNYNMNKNINKYCKKEDEKWNVLISE